MNPGKKVYFLSDFHLGVPDAESSLVREKRIVAFLDEAAEDLTTKVKKTKEPLSKKVESEMSGI